MDEVKKALDEEIISQIKGLSEMTDGCEAKTSAIDDLTALYKLRLEEEKLSNDLEVKKLEFQQETEQAELQKKEEEKRQKSIFWKEKISDGLKIGLEAVKIIVPVMAYVNCFRQGLNFEQTGTFTSGTMKNHIRYLNPFR